MLTAQSYCALHRLGHCPSLLLLQTVVGEGGFVCGEEVRLPGDPHIRPINYKYGGFHYHLSFDNPLEKFTKLRKVLYLWLQFYYQERAAQVVLVVKNLPANAGDIREVGLIPGLGWSPWGGHGNPLQCPGLENPKDRGAWRASPWARIKSDTTEMT